jgi:hypothetical protein
MERRFDTTIFALAACRSARMSALVPPPHGSTSIGLRILCAFMHALCAFMHARAQLLPILQLIP